MKMSRQEQDRLNRLGKRLEPHEWDDKKCDICGKPAEIRCKDMNGKEIGYRCAEHVPKPEEILAHIEHGGEGDL